jgi:hypothetical protein
LGELLLLFFLFWVMESGLGVFHTDFICARASICSRIAQSSASSFAAAAATAGS